ncbi:MAG: fibrobacter succinogenes major paralogous domain-containing protein [Candidatus Nomurabacteria bacterium]|jgi:hypothetical protein|nr:fibrobacter succinogenes major paralogous domain-containing protein [Candidatus Nomurabacteria bacterium]
MTKKAKTNVIASIAKQSSKKLTDFIKSHPRPLILSGAVLVFLSLIFINYSLTHAEDNIVLTINGGPTNNGQTITITKGQCTTFTLDTITTTNNSSGYTIKAYTKTHSKGITIKKQQQDTTEDLPTNPNNPTEIITTTTTATKDKQTTTYQACAGSNMADGAYSATIAYVLHENYAKVINGANFQDKTTNIDESCSALPTYPNEGSTIVMIDNRNGQEYLVRKLKDNKCWMIDNLKLELGKPDSDPTKDTGILEPDNTDVTEDTTVTLAAANLTNRFTTSGYLTVNGSGGSSDGASSNAWRQANPNDPNMSNTTNCQTNNGNTYNSNSKTGCGYLYNFYTAAAGTADHTKTSGDADGSICPAGWKLPTGKVGGDFSNLDLAYQPSGTGASHYFDEPDAQALWMRDGAWQGALSGDFLGGIRGQNNWGYYWSSSIVSATDAYDGWFVSDRVFPGTGENSRLLGYVIRCLAK